MRADIHPKYHNVLVHCACGNTFETRSTRPEIRVDVCAACHPYYTGAQKFVDTAGRVDKFRRRYARGGSTPAPQSGPSS
ncbi:MAG: 50S ribosomal protein L31 [Planctomycetes bacterium]|nr:50S ribosomal protein L31 [Planctomycetota bacterium]